MSFSTAAARFRNLYPDADLQPLLARYSLLGPVESELSVHEAEEAICEDQESFNIPSFDLLDLFGLENSSQIGLLSFEPVPQASRDEVGLPLVSLPDLTETTVLLATPAGDAIDLAEAFSPVPTLPPLINTTQVRSPSSLSLNSPGFDTRDASPASHNGRNPDLETLFNEHGHNSFQPDIFDVPDVHLGHPDQGHLMYPYPESAPSTPVQNPHKRPRLSSDDTSHPQWVDGDDIPAWSINTPYSGLVSTNSSQPPFDRVSPIEPQHNLVPSLFALPHQLITIPGTIQTPYSELLGWAGPEGDVPTYRDGYSALTSPSSSSSPAGSLRGTKRKRSPSDPPSSSAPTSSPLNSARCVRNQRAKKGKESNTQTTVCLWQIPDSNGNLTPCGEPLTNRNLPTHMREQHQPWVRDEHGFMVPCPDTHQLR
ncbi:hypothetical protein V5O48_015171, partial [Marasmius crinis-equi]